MKHNFQTINNKLRAYNTRRGKLTELCKEIEATVKELQQLKHDFGSIKLTDKAFDSLEVDISIGADNRVYINIDEVLGENNK